MSRLANISLVQLQYLVALEKHRHFIRAAESCSVTQPTLSMQIKKLEAELGVILFDRSKQPIIPTDVGLMIVEQAKSILRETQRIEDMLQSYKGEVSGDLHLGVIPTISPYLMPHLISNIRKMYPEIRLHVKEMLTEDIIAALLADQLDVGILSTPLHQERIAERPLFYEEFHVYMHPSHPAYEHRRVSVEDLLSDQLWLLSEGNCFRNQTINLCAMREEDLIDNMFDYESGSLETLMRIVDMEGGATIIPEWGSIDLSDQALINMRRTLDDSMVREVSMVYSRNYAKARLLDALEEVCDASVPKQLKDNKGKEVVDIELQ